MEKAQVCSFINGCLLQYSRSSFWLKSGIWLLFKIIFVSKRCTCRLFQCHFWFSWIKDVSAKTPPLVGFPEFGFRTEVNFLLRNHGDFWSNWKSVLWFGMFWNQWKIFKSLGIPMQSFAEKDGYFWSSIFWFWGKYFLIFYTMNFALLPLILVGLVQMVWM